MSAIAAMGTGGVPQARIRQMLADLVAGLSALHAQGRIHGGISMDTVVRGDADPVRLLDPSGEQAPPDGDETVRHPGYAPFEQYTDDPGWPCGPWTDIYALSALAHALVTGAPPPDALSRRVRDDYVPLLQRAPQGYDPAFLAGLDAGLSMPPSLRPQTLEAFDEVLLLPVPTPVAMAAGDAIGAVGAGTVAVAAGMSRMPADADAVDTAEGSATSETGGEAGQPAAAAAASAVIAPVPRSNATPANVDPAAATRTPAAEKEAPVGQPAANDAEAGAREKPRRASVMGIALVVAILAVAGFLWLRDDAPPAKVVGREAVPGPVADGQAENASNGQAGSAQNGQASSAQATPNSQASSALASPDSQGSSAQAAPDRQANTAPAAPSSQASSAPSESAPDATQTPPTAAQTPTAGSASGAQASAAGRPETGGGADLPQAPAASDPAIATATLGGALPIPDRRTAPGSVTVQDPQAVASAHPATPQPPASQTSTSTSAATTAPPAVPSAAAPQAAPSQGASSQAAASRSAAAQAAATQAAEAQAANSRIVGSQALEAQAASGQAASGPAASGQAGTARVAASPAAMTPGAVASASADAEMSPKPKGPVTVRVDVRPWGEVFVDGKSRGLSPPLRELKLSPGKHAVIVRNAGLPPYSVTLDLADNRAAAISHVFQ
ncbi:hypothetical protein CAL29_02615 [Bordetella genomosp. 10]|uniref:Protein kinase domain-containing protein n=1 Tax=Bordetella genomosp. 10 TaxID=1416804 RepID=A0A261SJX0_9BORD|nr:hypothetical protein [Bordetella genomosp. 10]OZI37331.1 hypothetical protein CAL29_02615 [Bordetella genomosp. 10]